MRWSTADLADVVLEGLRQRARMDDLEQAVYGFDALDELGLHPIVHACLRAAGYGVWPEVRYPTDWVKSRKSEGKRCDVVLTPAPGALPLRDPEIKGTLFDDQPACDPQDAYWLEIKTVAQFEKAGPFRRYSAELLSPVAEDVKKIWNDGLIRFGGLLLLLFTEDLHVGEHDVAAWHNRCLERGYPVAVPAVRSLKINNRIGNAWCTAAVFGIRGC